MATQGDRFVVTIEDDAPAFDPTTVEAPDLSVHPGERRLGGMGVLLARLCVDEMTYRPRPGGGNRPRRIDDELALGRRLQRSFLTLEAPDAPGYDLASHYEQAPSSGPAALDSRRGACTRRSRRLGAARGGRAFDVIDSIRGSVDAFQSGALAADDVTIVAIGRRPRGRRRAAPRAAVES